MYIQKMYINGQWKSCKEEMEVRNPANLEVIGTIPRGGAEEASQAVDAAFAALGAWSALTAGERAQLLMKWHALIETHTQELAEIMTTEQGKPLKEAAGEIAYANSFVSWYAEEGKRVYGQTIPASAPNKRIWVQKQPVGVIAAITPWNFPASMITRKVAPALAAGCTVVLKPSEKTPFTALKLAQLAEQAGIPAGVLNVVTGDAAPIAEAWQRDERVRKISFTGSTAVGKTLMRGAADTVKKISLELGGHAPFIVTANADLDKAVNGFIASKFRNGGQTCVCTNRVYVEEGIAEEFAAKAAERTSALKVGNGMVEGVDVGPLINAKAVDKVKRQIADAKAKGGRVLAGGDAPEDASGYFMMPTVIMDATDEMECMNEETFGPLAPIATFRTLEEAVQRANRSPYGLAAYVFTERIREAIYAAEALEYGIVGVNDPLPSTAQAPFGGFKQSGLGREGGHFGIEEYLEIKYISLGL
ncbi:MULTISPECIES: NAD-dependent succinate-semialdehyde dehydrogenase [Paenibacillus]|uniref:NAD-dependent succinate-semialdehyde dehydrogenase n=1 Tax=Paenibacillus albilobatus TaxID=2716884 RepID=A0A919XFQ0_9BACL|nr:MULTISPECIES: NAD-dependent succinate-semialdehyde dehydrogenase [Paenibacillus]GIO30120.1 NAD-dependent succinate-semialdehyde dehydrogenase [Paenibacillus albilobatus]